MNHLIKKTPTPSLTNKWADAAWSRHFSRFAGVAVALLGLLIIVSWYARWQSMVQMLPQTAPMQYNTALCFVWCGAGLFLLTTAREKIAPWFGGGAATMAFLTLLEYLTGLDFRIDQIFFKPWFHVATGFPGRMSPLAAFCFIFIGTGIVFVGAKKSWPHRLTAAGILSCTVGVVVLVALSGFVFGIESATGWGAYSRIAINTSAAFLVLSVGLLVWCWQTARREKFDFLRWLPITGSVTLMVMIAFVSLVSFEQLKDSAGWRKHSYDVLADAQTFLGDLFDIQNGTRGYVLTGQSNPLSVYEVGVSNAPRHLDELDAITRDNFPQRDRVKVLAVDLADFLDYSRRLTEARTTQGLPAAVQMESTGEGFAVMKRTLVDLETFSAAERLLLIERSSSMESGFRSTARLLVLGSVLAAGLLVLANLMASREAKRRRQSEEALRASKERLLRSQTLLRMAGRLGRIGAWSVELPQFEQIWSEEVCAIYGVPPGTSLSVQETINRYAPEFHETITHAFEECVRDGTPYDVELQIIAADNQSVWVRAIGEAERDAAGVIQRVQGALQDITERKRLEVQLFQSQKMETVGKLAGGVAHQFNSILTAIMGQSELLLNELTPDNPLSRNVAEISKAAGRAAGLTRQLLAYGRKQILQPEILNLNSVLSEMESTLCHLAGGKVELLIVPAAGLKTVKIDPGQMQQVIANLVMNAADAMPDGGKLTLETTNVSFSQEKGGPSPELKLGDHVMLAITDTGTGMTEELRARIFEPFFTTKDIGQGTGLGLSTCYGIIKQSGGHIDVYSEPGWGTSFKIYLPQVNQQARIPAPKVAPPALSGGTETILLVEDDPALREMAAASLERLGYTVLAAANGIEALRLKQQDDFGHIDLLFTDVVMPQMNGKELADRIQSSSPSTRILFTSAYTENSIVHQGVLDPGVALLAKPFTPASLARKIREVIDAEDTVMAETVI